MDQHSQDCGCSSCSDDKATLALLQEHHQFPCEYMFKVIGFEHDEFAAEVRRAAEVVLGPLLEKGQVRSRPSSGGKYLAVTLEVPVDSAQQVLAIYAGLKKIEGVAVLV